MLILHAFSYLPPCTAAVLHSRIQLHPRSCVRYFRIATSAKALLWGVANIWVIPCSLARRSISRDMFWSSAPSSTAGRMWVWMSMSLFGITQMPPFDRPRFKHSDRGLFVFMPLRGSTRPPGKYSGPPPAFRRRRSPAGHFG